MEITLLNNQTVAIKLEYDARKVGLIKSFVGARYIPSSKLWTLPVDGLLKSSLELLQSKVEDLVIDQRVLDQLNPQTQPTIDSIATQLPLYPYQAEIVTFLVNNPFSLNASFVGSGKTLTSLALCDTLDLRKVLVIAPKSVALQWAEQEIPKWLGEDLNILPIAGDLSQRVLQYSRAAIFNSQKFYMVVGYETARIDADLLSQIDWDIIICDEAHRLANPSTKLYKALKKLKSKRRLALTATPIMNKAEDMFGLVNWLKPGVLGNYYQFINRYSVKDHWGSIQYYKNLPELVSRTQPYIIRKTLDEVDMQLPPYTESILPVELSSKERKLYDQMKAELLFEIEAMQISKIENPVGLQMSVVKMGKLFELCDSMELLGEEKTSSKIEAIKELLDNILID